MGGSKVELNDAVVVVAVVSVAAAVAVAAVAVVREGKPEPPWSVSVVECRWIQLPLSDLRRKWMFSECRRYRGNEMRVGQGLLLKEELACFDGCGKREGCWSRRKEQITHQPHHHSLVVEYKKMIANLKF